MAALSEIRSALAGSLSSIQGLRTSAHVPDQPNPPIAVVVPEQIEYDASTFGSHRYTFRLMLIVGRVDERNAQARLDGYLATDGAASVKSAVEADRTLGGLVQVVRVLSADSYRTVPVGDVTYLTAEMVVEVISQ